MGQRTRSKGDTASSPGASSSKDGSPQAGQSQPGEATSWTDDRRAASLLRATLESTHDGVLAVDLAGRIQTCNRRFLEMWRLPSLEAIFANGRPHLHREAIVRDQLRDPEGFIERVNQVLARPREESFDVIEFKDGRVFERYSLPQLVDDQVVGRVWSFRDATEQKRAEQRLAMEHGVTRVLAECETLAQAIPRTIDIIARTMAWDCAAHWVLDPSGESIRCAQTWSEDEKLARFVTATRETVLAMSTSSLVRNVWLSGEPRWLTDVAREPEFTRSRAALEASLHGGLVFPLRAGTATLGVLEFFARDSRRLDEPLLQMARVIGSQVGQFMARKKAEQDLLHAATHDALTGLPNRYMFNQRFAHALNHAQRYGRHMAVLFLDLDRFKDVNDTRGHTCGDAVLAQLGQRLSEALRDSDTVARFGGDEFVALIEEVATPGDAASVAQKLLEVIRKPMLVEGESCCVSGSIGVSLYPEDGVDQASLLKSADIAVYRAKHQGPGSYASRSADRDAQLMQRLSIEGSLKSALEREELVLHYQPRVAIASGRITGLEALIRWQHATMGLVLPAQFIGQAEASGHIVPIGNWVLGQACRDARRFLDARGGPLSVSVNLSARQFEDPHLMRAVERALEQSGLAPEQLELEITESMMMHDPVAALQTLTDMKALGIRLALDDFGTGYSSLASIKQFPFDCIKIDLSFVRDIPENPDDATLARAIIGMGHSLRHVVVAEGVERPEQLRWLAEHHCDEYQGYLFGKPAPADEVLELLRAEAGRA